MSNIKNEVRAVLNSPRQGDNVRRKLRELRQLTAEREALRAEGEADFVNVEGARRFDHWLESMRQQFREEARVEYRAQHPPHTLEHEAATRYRATQNANDSARRQNFKLRPEAQGLTGEAFEKALEASFEAEVEAHAAFMAAADEEVPHE